MGRSCKLCFDCKLMCLFLWKLSVWLIGVVAHLFIVFLVSSVLNAMIPGKLQLFYYHQNKKVCCLIWSDTSDLELTCALMTFACRSLTMRCSQWVSSMLSHCKIVTFVTPRTTSKKWLRMTHIRSTDYQKRNYKELGSRECDLGPQSSLSSGSLRRFGNRILTGKPNIM